MSGVFKQNGQSSESDIFILKSNCLVFNLLCKILNWVYLLKTHLGSF